MKQYKREEALEVVKSGYNQLGSLYSSERNEFDNCIEISAFTSKLPVNGKVLDARCGTGIPIARLLIQAGFEVVGIDFSKTMVETARKNVPGATFKLMDMTDIDLAPESFDGVISTYAIIHIPREKHARIFQSFHSILRSGGVMLVSIGTCA